MDVFFEIHSGNRREGPGCDACTRRAVSVLPALPPKVRVLDMGCGPGAQTLELARVLDGEIIALDNHEPFLDGLRARGSREPLKASILPTRGDMASPYFSDASFDLIWAEGSIYIIGFERGLSEWKRLLRRGGYMAVTEISWLKDDPPGELVEFWERAYPGMQSVARNCATVGACGYELIEHFTLPESAWLDEYYGPIRRRLEALRQKYAGVPEAMEVIADEEEEMALYSRYSSFYGYEFYVMRLP